MFKKTLLAVIVAGITTPAVFADLTNSAFNGFYLGAGLGTASFSDQEKTVFNYTDGAPAVSYPRGGTGLAGQFFAGYGQAIDNFYLGGQAFLATNTARNTIDQTSTDDLAGISYNYSIATSLRDSYGLQLRPGYLVSDNTLFYVPLGVVVSQLNWTTSNATSNVASIDHPLVGAQIGAGIETFIQPNLSLRAEYVYARYQDYTSHFSSPDIVDKARTFPFRDNEFDLGVAYHFNDSHQAPTCATTELHSGPYVGVMAGRENLLIKQNLNNYDATDLSSLGQTEQVNAHGGMSGNLLAGYSWVINPLYVGTEVSGTIADTKVTSTDAGWNAYFAALGTDQNSEYKLTPAAEVSLLPSVMLNNDIVLYGKVGAALGKYQVSYLSPGYQTIDNHKNLTGMVLGLGLQTMLTEHLALRGEYSHTQYEAVNYSLVPADSSIVTGYNNLDKPMTEEYKLGLVYLF